MSQRLENLLGALVVALGDELDAEVETAAGRPGATAAALAVLAQEPGLGIEQLKLPLRRTQSATVRVVDQLVAGGHAERRPGHDRRYALDWSKIQRELGWSPTIPFERGLVETVAWYAANRAWWEPLRDRAPVKEDAWT